MRYGCRVDWLTVIRSLGSDELPWFVGRALAFMGHADPNWMSLKLSTRFSDPRADAASCHVLARPEEAPSAGVVVLAPDPDDDARNLVFYSPWHEDGAEDLGELVGALLERFPHESAVLRLDAVPEARRRDLAVALEPLGFEVDELRSLSFDLSQVPPIGSPLLFEAWSLPSDRRFREFYAAAENRRVSDAGWAYLKRRHGPFQPDLWFLARETLDQEPVGYAFFGLGNRRVDGRYTLDAVGVAHELRSDSTMLRRVVISALQELASFSPLGTVEAEVSLLDGKLGDLLRLVGFTQVSRSHVLVKRPG